ncbi:MAG TPA: hypothetical protein VF337_04315, partial [Candidatus Limnocylindrales bacterium]
YLLTYPVLCRVRPDGSGEQDIKSSLIQRYGGKTFFWMRHPSISPDGSTAAMISDGPTDPGFSDSVLSFISLAGGAFENTPELPDVTPLGHSEPAYSPDGKLVAYVEEGRNGDIGDPSIWLYDTARRTARVLARGYRQPAWSPDGEYLAVTKSGSSRPDIAVIDASTGSLIGQVTGDGASWSPVWSPAGDSLIYMNIQGSVARLRMVRISVSAAQVSSSIATWAGDYSGLDPGSAAAWYIPDLPGASSSPLGDMP